MSNDYLALIVSIFAVSGGIVFISTMIQQRTASLWIDHGSIIRNKYHSMEKAIDSYDKRVNVDEAIQAQSPISSVDINMKDKHFAHNKTNTDEVMVAVGSIDEKWPPLDSLIGDNKANIIGDVQFMLDFAIIGHPKTASTFTMYWLAGHDEVAMYKHEVRSLRKGLPADFVSQLYDLPKGRYYKRGYKNPDDLKSDNALGAIAKYWPKTRLIVGFVIL